ncbi:hypothetical protein AKI39_23605 [Bordetella sp. H567]|nr:hypothetical protein AKI39_23605 [Bordetella sp. H567]
MGTKLPVVNSEGYWTRRFHDDWESLGGPEQTRFFYKTALDNLPKWFSEKIRREKASMCDWGCATGDGTDLLAQILDVPVVGVDFSDVAIQTARGRYSKPEFQAVDYLSRENRPSQAKYDILFTSNTLEHFPNPQEVLKDLAVLARKYLVVLVPFREYDRHHEHEATFDQENIPISIADRFDLVFSRVVDLSGHQPSYWAGEQILLIYAAREEIKSLNLCLDSLEITRESIPTGVELGMAKATIASLEEAVTALRADLGAAQEALRESSSQLERVRSELKLANHQYLEQTHAWEKREAELRHALMAHDAELRDREAAVLERDLTIAAIKHSTSWRLTKPLRAVGHVVRLGKRKMHSAARLAYHKTPVPQAWKHALKQRLLGGASLPLPAATTVPEAMSSIVPQLVPPLRGAKDRADVFVWGIIDWHFRIQRPQHIARGMARRGHRTYYFSNHFIDDPKPGFRIEVLSEDGLLNVVYLHVAGVPSIYSAAASAKTTEDLRASLAVFLVEAAPASIISMVQHPFWVPFADRLPNRHLVYDMMDHHEGFGDGAPDILELEERILREADQVIVTSDFLEKIARAKNSSVHVVRNACEYEHFATRPDKVFEDPLGRQIIGYYGAIAHWFDVDLVERVAQAFPDALVLLVGADSAGVQERLRHCPNVQFTGEVKYIDLPFYLYAFDVCLLLFKIIPLTLATNPVKVYEYLSAGRHVVAVDLPEMAQFSGLVSVGREEAEIMDHIRAALRTPPTDAEVTQRRRFASSQTWDDRAHTLSLAIDQYNPPLVSLVLVTYNKLELTDACLRSIEKNTHYKNFEVIVVDNNSRDATPEYLKEWVTRGKNRQIILNADNRGFAAANNQGLKIARGHYLVLLNNDTYVTPGWLGTLVRHLERDTASGIVGPVTNNIGNEAKIDIAYNTMEEMEYAARLYTAGHMGQSFAIYTAAFFCVALSRKMYEEVGDLDEAFGIGMFEDDDYCRRIQQRGYIVRCAEDVFIHHHHSASFNLMAVDARAKLFTQNRELYERKWGPWQPHEYRPGFGRIL